MTDKHIIIDGCDVSGCEYRCDTHKTLLADGHIMEFENYCQITNDGCYAINCYYKQLKAKEQECEELDKQLISFMNGDYCDNGCSLKQQLDKLKAENEELKVKLDKALDKWNEFMDKYQAEKEKVKMSKKGF